MLHPLAHHPLPGGQQKAITKAGGVFATHGAVIIAL